jgi:hypothetical protein
MPPRVGHAAEPPSLDAGAKVILDRAAPLHVPTRTCGPGHVKMLVAACRLWAQEAEDLGICVIGEEEWANVAEAQLPLRGCKRVGAPSK